MSLRQLAVTAPSHADTPPAESEGKTLYEERPGPTRSPEPLGDPAPSGGYLDGAMEYRVLGPVEVVGSDGDPTIPLPSRRQRLLLACLIANAGQVLSSDRLVDALWPDNLPADPQDALQSQISRLRRRLGPSAPIETTPAGYRFTAAARVDAARFECLIDDARLARDPQDGLATWDRALALWHGPAFGDVADHPAVQPSAVRLEQLRVEATEARTETLLRVGKVPDALTQADTLCAAEPLRERPVALLMRALATSGRHVEALRAYERFRRTLAEEVGLDPSPELRALESDIIRHAQPHPDGHPAASERGEGQGFPAASTSFVGRRDILDTVIHALGSSRLVTITGPGGIGKTRLALETARRRTDAYPGGASLCELGPVPDVAGVMFALAAAVGLHQPAGVSIEDSIIEALATRELLLVVDNCEHVLEGVVPLLERLLARCPHLRILATSRERLAADGETVVDLPPLEVPEDDVDPDRAWEQPTGAMQLLADRLRALRPGFAPGPHQRAALSEIVRRLDGLPLALELAAARVATMGPVEVARRLEDPFSLLTRGRRTAPDRQRTLRATVEWSYTLLADAEQRAFERTSVFAGGFTIAAAEALTAGTDDDSGADDTADLISRLVDKSMIMLDDRGPIPRFRLLEPLRHFGHALLVERGRFSAVEKAHCAYYLDLAWRAEPHLRGPGEADSVRTLESEIPNLRAARTWAMRSGHRATAAELSAALFWFGYWRMHPEVMGWAEELAEAEPVVDGPHLVLVLAAAGAAAWRRSDLPRAQALGERILSMTGDDVSARYGWQLLGTIAAFEGRLRDACDAFIRTADLARKDADHYHAAIALGVLALVQSYAGEQSAAVASAAANRVEAVRSGAPSALAYNAFTLGEILAPSEPHEALTQLDRAVALSDTVAAHFIHGIALGSATSLRVRLSDPGTAASALLGVVDHWRRAGNWRQQWTTLRHGVELLARIGADTAAATVLGAIETHDRTNIFGADADRLAALRATLQNRLGPTAEDHMANGRGLHAEEVVAFTCRALAEVSGRHR